jgi:hypothetical protein
MTKRRVWLLALAAGLFAAWIGYLAYLVVMTTHQRLEWNKPPIVLSRPQFLVADYWVIAEVKDREQPIKIVEVVYVSPPAKEKAPEKGAEIKLSNLPECQDYWSEPGTYIIALSRFEDGYRVTPVPHGPPALPPRIYPDTEETRAQLDQLPRPKAASG